ncbi:unnamed protein product [Arabidopsis thaliana]|uniref:Uncharacterized protein n=1 Tax=Arabidopsis thaliana TaxID=3702 RepID=A0A654FCS8_ARATH|nr:unnamed protein product [Arabidopsis thaliana]
MFKVIHLPWKEEGSDRRFLNQIKKAIQSPRKKKSYVFSNCYKNGFVSRWRRTLEVKITWESDSVASFYMVLCIKYTANIMVLYQDRRFLIGNEPNLRKPFSLCESTRVRTSFLPRANERSYIYQLHITTFLGSISSQEPMRSAIKWQFISQFGDENIDVKFWFSSQEKMRGCVSWRYL